MPSRWTSLAIVGFWLIMMGWLAVREVERRSGESPSLEDALAASAEDAPVSWLILENGQPMGRATTQVTKEPRTGRHELLQTVHLDRIFNLNWSLDLITRAEVNLLGQLQRYSLQASVPEIRLRYYAECKLRDDKKEMHVRTTVSVAGEDLSKDEYTIQQSGKDLIFSSLCPLDRIPNLKPGQHWEARMVDPMNSIGPLSSMGPTLARALDRPPTRVQVLKEPQLLRWPPEDGSDVSCLVVDSKQSDLHVQIWVREEDGLVLKQSARWGSTTLDIIRDQRKPEGER